MIDCQAKTYIRNEDKNFDILHIEYRTVHTICDRPPEFKSYHIHFFVIVQ